MKVIKGISSYNNDEEDTTNTDYPASTGITTLLALQPQR